MARTTLAFSLAISVVACEAQPNSRTNTNEGSPAAPPVAPQIVDAEACKRTLAAAIPPLERVSRQFESALARQQRVVKPSWEADLKDLAEAQSDLKAAVQRVADLQKESGHLVAAIRKDPTLAGLGPDDQVDPRAARVAVDISLAGDLREAKTRIVTHRRAVDRLQPRCARYAEPMARLSALKAVVEGIQGVKKGLQLAAPGVREDLASLRNKSNELRVRVDWVPVARVVDAASQPGGGCAPVAH